MIKRDKELFGETSFSEWASLFSGKYFVMIAVYADESGTHDPEGVLPGSAHPVIAGYAAKKSTWDTFCISWRAVLDKYDVDYFHAKELRAAREAIIHNKPESKELLKNPYYIKKWDLKKIQAFFETLAKIAGSGSKVPILGNVNLPYFHKVKGSVEFSNPDIKLDNPYKICMSDFFRGYHKETWLQWGDFKCSVNFVFDQNQKREWISAIHEVFNAFQKEDTRMGILAFGDKKKKENLPLQAADLLAYRARKLAEDNVKNNQMVLEKVDQLLFMNVFRTAKIKHRISTGAL